MKCPVAVSFGSGGELVSYKHSPSASNPPTGSSKDTRIIRPSLNVLIFEKQKGAVASALVDFTMPSNNVEYNCLINAIMDLSGCYMMYMQFFGDESLGHMIRMHKISVIL
ncbi:hypothetical protein MKX03_001433 [Papaver bracteatum]|nr:hypothetical protein MKX03_001433 [Papaver bracteatum]